MSQVARDIMTENPESVESTTTVADAARKLAELNVGALPICDGDKLQGMITDRDIAVKVVAEGRDPNTVKVIDVTTATEVVTIGADDSVEEAMRTMGKHQVRRLPVIDGDKMVGIVSQADIARALPEAKVGDMLEDISQP
jgi:CBS domain-containing protein